MSEVWDAILLAGAITVIFFGALLVIWWLREFHGR